jgi:8-oxo-dGTP diphosphatase
MAGSVIIIENNKMFLLQLRSNTTKSCPNKWGLFGGGIEENETPLQAIIREINEELELELKIHEIELMFKTIYLNEEINIFKTKINKELQELKLNEGKDMRYFTKEEILNLDNLSPGIKELFEQYI